MSSRAIRPHARVTLRDVAEVAGVNAATVSRALNEQSRSLVKDDTAERVLAAAAELGYRPNPLARGLKTNRSYTVGVLIPDLTNPLFPPIVRGIQDRLEAAGYTPLLANTDNDAERERTDFEAMRARQVDGFVTATAHRHDALLEEIASSGTPLVLVNRSVEDGGLSAVAGDDRKGMQLAVEHLVELGHRQIALLGGPVGLSTGFERRQGFVDALRARGLDADEQLMLSSESFTEAEGARLCRELLARERPFTAIVAGNDLMALGCYDGLAERSMRCPEHVSVVGYNDMPFADRFAPPLTTIRIPQHELGARAAELLLEQLADPAAQPHQVLLEPELVVRGSTTRAAAPPPRRRRSRR